jgi:ankyrin repeat protein
LQVRFLFPAILLLLSGCGGSGAPVGTAANGPQPPSGFAGVPDEAALPALRHGKGRYDTPHKLIREGYPKEAIAMMEGDRRWISEEVEWCQPLHIAAQENQVEVAQWLLANGADVNAKGTNDATPVHMANGQLEVLRVLLKAKPNLETDGWIGTPLQDAVREMHQADDEATRKRWKEVADLLVAAGATRDLTVAIYLNDIAHVRSILTAAPRRANEYQPDLPLRLAAKLGRLEICKLLLDVRGADVNDFERGAGYPVMMEALKHPEVVELLIERGADLDTRITFRGGRSGIWIINDNATLLHHAANKGVPETINLLFDHGIDVFALADGNSALVAPVQTALDVAAIFGRADNALAIVSHPKFKEAPIEVRQPILDRCLVRGSNPFDDESGELGVFCKVLLQAGANPNAVYRGQTAIQEAASRLEPEDSDDPDAKLRNDAIRNGIAVLRKAGGEVDLVSAVALGDEGRVATILEKNPKAAASLGPDGVPALHEAVRLDHRRIVTMLLDAGCDVNLPNQSEETMGKGTTALDWANFYRRYELVELLSAAGGKESASEELSEK